MGEWEEGNTKVNTVFISLEWFLLRTYNVENIGTWRPAEATLLSIIFFCRPVYSYNLWRWIFCGGVPSRSVFLLLLIMEEKIHFPVSLAARRLPASPGGTARGNAGRHFLVINYNSIQKPWREGMPRPPTTGRVTNLSRPRPPPL